MESNAQYQWEPSIKNEPPEPIKQEQGPSQGSSLQTIPLASSRAWPHGSQPKGLGPTSALKFGDGAGFPTSTMNSHHHARQNYPYAPTKPIASSLADSSQAESFRAPGFWTLQASAGVYQNAANLPMIEGKRESKYLSNTSVPVMPRLTAASVSSAFASPPVPTIAPYDYVNTLPPPHSCAYPPSLHPSYSFSKQHPPLLPLPRGGVPLSRILPQLTPAPSVPASSIGEPDIDMDENSSDDFSDEGYILPKTELLFDDTKSWCSFYDREGLVVPVEISCKFTKQYGEDRDYWIFYRRNYFAVSCSFSFKPPSSNSGSRLYLGRPEEAHRQPVQALAMRMRGTVNSEDGRDVEIVVFNTKRRPIGKPEMEKMKPNMPGYSRVYHKSTGEASYDHTLPPGRHYPCSNHTFLRNQFRLATQNNGARRKDQEYYHIVIELMAEVAAPGSVSKQWIRVASRVSGPILTRGRCPQSFEKYDPNNPDHGRRRPRRDDHGGGRRKDNRPRPNKKHFRSSGGHQGSAPESTAPKTGGSSHKSSQRSSSLTTTPSIPGLTRGPKSWMSTTAPMSPISSSSGLVTPEEDNIILPHMDDLHLIATRYSSDDECGDDDNILSKHWTQQQTDAGRREMALVAHQLSPYGFDFDVPEKNAFFGGHASMDSSTSTTRGYTDGSTTWERLEGHWVDSYSNSML